MDQHRWISIARGVRFPSQFWPVLALNGSYLTEHKKNEYSIDESPNWMIEELLEDYPHYEVKEMKYEIDGVVSVKKVLVEKELEVA